ncbi:DUF4097 family beta strand repeat-containing protein [Lentzea sp. BCCO 10_0798]|uniref:DUF4097 family beta strand repeat-containing protein n=1 Tax=Lentzea kristufekii TaxID=3095430 RepID=A0ABU4TWJ5_9PSEU|nr:DUF4097 family beta strand repeat-containing protein [Lentzea sp. BCCO 10_0798]MDX8052453.1 DUF4097 family beta strand repeat-containing protein [Lentzea sp. BCCO 10_0798]
MPSYETPEPISVLLDVYAGYVQIVASDRTDTTVEVRPSDPSDSSDVEAAQKTKVDYADGTLTVRGPKRTFDFSKKTRAVDVVIELPTGSKVDADVSAGSVRTSGVLGVTEVDMSAGNIHLDRTGPLKADTGAGVVNIGAVEGNADVKTGSGHIRIGTVHGALIAKNSNGHIDAGTVEGELKARSANGDITVERAGGPAEARTAMGSINVGEVVRDTVTLNTAMGGIEIGIAPGTAAWIDAKTSFGRVTNALEGSDGPGNSAETVRVTAHTSFGDITVRRS